MMAHPQYISFTAFRQFCMLRDMQAVLQIFDGGETVTVKDNYGKQLVRITREYGQPENASAAAYAWLIENDYVSSGDLG